MRPVQFLTLDSIISAYSYFNKGCRREWRMSNGGCTTERNCGMWYVDMQNFISCIHLKWKWIHQLWTFVWALLTSKTKETHAFLNWKTFLVSSYERLIISDFASSVARKFRNIALNRFFRNAQERWSLCTECWRTWTNHITRHRRSSLNGAGIID